MDKAGQYRSVFNITRAASLLGFSSKRRSMRLIMVLVSFESNRGERACGPSRRRVTILCAQAAVSSFAQTLPGSRSRMWQRSNAIRAKTTKSRSFIVEGIDEWEFALAPKKSPDWHSPDWAVHIQKYWERNYVFIWPIRMV
jgi:hypothetical protein